MNIEIILIIFFYLLLIDAIGANVVSWLGFSRWYQDNLNLMARYFPMTKGWTTLYFALVIFNGVIVHYFVAPLF